MSVAEENVTREFQSENHELLRLVREGDSEALECLVDQNLGLVKKIALRFIGRGAEYEDLVQIGVIGMIKAARSFDFEYGTAFSTYAVPLIMGEIRRFLRDDGPIKVGRAVKQRGREIMKARESFISEHCREARISELSALTGYTEEEIVACIEAQSPIVSLNEPIGADENGATLESGLADESNALDTLTDRIALSEAIRRLPPLWRNIVELRYFKELSQNETGKRLGITQVKVSREEQKILHSLRQALG